jgi:hypothetical protein
MRLLTKLVRTGFWLTTSSLSLSALAPAIAQPAPPPGAEQPGAEQAGEQGTDPPALAGRLAEITGSVSFHDAGETQWSAATQNYPVTNGSAFWTEPGAQARLEIADDRLVMDGSTELDVNALDQSQMSVTEAQGAIFLQLNSLPSGQTVTITTPRGAVQITATGRYEVVAGDTNDATTITVVEGAAHVSGTNLAVDIGPQQTATIAGSDTLQGSVEAMQQDTFLQSMLRLPAKPHFAAAIPPQVQYMTGSEDLQTYGSFARNAQYGQVWYPRDVGRNWAPYRDGHWAYVQPWGWTWVDNARWGFAPFHYGRWVQVDDRWGWVAGGGGDVDAQSPYPVYSPALVSFVGVGAAGLASVAIGFGAGDGGYAPAWIPLGPREPYYPWYHCRPDYFSRINNPYGVPRAIIERGPTYNTNITNVRVINNTRTNIFINQRAATVIPAAAFARGASVAALGRPLPERALVDARPVIGRLPVRPTAETANLPPAAARRYNVALPSKPVRPAAAGPRIQPSSGHEKIAPELRKAALPGNVRSVPADRPAGAPRGPESKPAGVPLHAGAPLPALRTPGAPRPMATVVPGARPAPAGKPGHTPPAFQAGPPSNTSGGSLTPPLRPGEAGSGRHVQAPGEREMPPHAGAVPLPQVIRPSEPVSHAAPPRANEPRHAPAEGVRPAETAHEPPRQPATRMERPREAAVPRSPEPASARNEAPRPVPHVEAPRPVPRMEAPHPAPREETPRPAPRMEAPRPAPHMEAPRPAPHVEAPRPAPQRQAPPPHQAAPAQRRPAEPPKHPTP